MNRYEACLYNQWVCLLIDSGEPNVTGFSDAWAEPRYVEVFAASLEQAVRLLARDYPQEVGFVLRAIQAIDAEPMEADSRRRP